jgi:cell division protein FtsW (lipid II flippase)
MLVLFATDDLGSALLFYGIFLGMLYAATARLAFVAAGLGLFLAGSAAVYRGTPHVRERVLNWLQPWTTHKIFCPLNGQPALRQDCQSYQEVQSLYSIAHGQMGGTGLGAGTFRNASGGLIIPDLKTDFIYSALAQELGLIGAAGLLLLYMVFVLRGFRVSLFASDGFSKLLAAGLTFGFALQTFIIVGGILRVIPLSGITLPLVSYGGSSIVANFLVLAGLMLVSNRANTELAGRS